MTTAALQLDVATIDANSLVLTPNHRLANHIKYQCAKLSLAKDKKLNSAYMVYPFSLWQQKLWQELEFFFPGFKLLSDFQAQVVWQDIIRQEAATPLLRINSTAKLAFKAWQHIIRYKIPVEEFITSYSNLDALAFTKWVEGYRKICEQEQWLDNNTVLEVILPYIAKLQELPKRIYWVEFLELPPLLQQLWQELDKLKTSCSIAKLNSTTESTAKITQGDNFEQIMLAASSWANNLIKEDIDVNVGIIVPNLAESRDVVTRVLAKILPADSYNVAAPKSITKLELVSSFLTLLRCSIDSSLELDTLSQILRSPYIKPDISTDARHIVDVKFREYRQDKFSKAKIIQILQEASVELDLAEFNATFIEWSKLQPSLYVKKSIFVWVEQVQQIISLWYAPEKVSEVEQQGYNCWLLLLEEWLTLTTIKNELNYTTAITLLEQLANDTPFAAETGRPLIQVLGLLEAVGLPFSHLWVCGMEQTSWPTMAEPNPFIPRILQHKYKVPRSSAARELEFCSEVTRVLAKMAAISTIYSYVKDSEMQSPSKLLKALPQIELTKIANTIENKDAKEAVYEFFNDEFAEPLTTEIQVGSNLLAMQANCPFSAFAVYRLGVEKILAPSRLDATVIGDVIHAVLAEFWSKYKNQKNLLAINSEKLIKYLTEITLLKLEKHSLTKSLPCELLQQEAARIAAVLNNWLEAEKTREPFEVVATELKCNIQLKNISFNLRVDRVDNVAVNSKVLLDYKTGSVTVDWFEKRPRSNQLLLYSLAHPDAIALVYALVNKEKSKFLGVAATQDTLPKNGVEMSHFSWVEQKEVWRQEIMSIVDEFINGYAKVAPLAPNSCDYCHLRLACRVKNVTK